MHELHANGLSSTEPTRETGVPPRTASSGPARGGGSSRQTRERGDARRSWRPKRNPAVPFSGRERRRLSRVAFPSEELGEQFVGALCDAVPEIRIFVGGRCATRYPAIAEQFGVHVCGDAAEAVAFLAT